MSWLKNRLLIPPDPQNPEEVAAWTQQVQQVAAKLASAESGHPPNSLELSELEMEVLQRACSDAVRLPIAELDLEQRQAMDDICAELVRNPEGGSQRDRVYEAARKMDWLDEGGQASSARYPLNLAKMYVVMTTTEGHFMVAPEWPTLESPDISDEIEGPLTPEAAVDTLADILSTSPGAVQAKLRRERKRIQTEGEAGADFGLLPDLESLPSGWPY